MRESATTKRYLGLLAVFIGAIGFGQEESTFQKLIRAGDSEPTGSTLEYYGEARGYLAEPECADSNKGQRQSEPVHTEASHIKPECDRTYSGIVLVHPWGGLDEVRIKQVADVLADQDFIVLAVDLYSGRTGFDAQENMIIAQKIFEKPEEIVANLNAAVSYVKERSDSNGMVSTIGWGIGANIALSFAMTGIKHHGTAIFDAFPVTDPKVLRNIDHEIYGTFAGEDRNIPVSQVNTFVAALQDAEVPNDIHIYDLMPHGFSLKLKAHLETERDAIKHAWDRLDVYLDRVLLSQPPSE